MALTLTPVENGAGAGAAFGFFAALVFFRKPNLAEVAVGTLVGGFLGAMASQAHASSVITVTSTPGGTARSPSAIPANAPNPNVAGGGGSSF